MTLFTATDIDGDTITIERNEDGILTATIAGEDGHRTVILSSDDIRRLGEFAHDFA